MVASMSLALNPGRRLLANELPLVLAVLEAPVAASVAVTVGVTSVRLTTMALD